MLTSKKSRRGVIGAVVLAGVLAVSGYALTNTATVPVSYAGEGTGAVTAVTASLIHYDVDAVDATFINKVNFTIAEPVAASAKAYVQFDGGSTGTQVGIPNGAWVDSTCVGTGTGGPNSTWVCTYAGGLEPAVLAATNLHVVVAD